MVRVLGDFFFPQRFSRDMCCLFFGLVEFLSLGLKLRLVLWNWSLAICVGAQCFKLMLFWKDWCVAVESLDDF